VVVEDRQEQESIRVPMSRPKVSRNSRPCNSANVVGSGDATIVMPPRRACRRTPRPAAGHAGSLHRSGSPRPAQCDDLRHATRRATLTDSVYAIWRGRCRAELSVGVGCRRWTNGVTDNRCTGQVDSTESRSQNAADEADEGGPHRRGYQGDAPREPRPLGGANKAHWGSPPRQVADDDGPTLPVA
jgi:hypothetical protein